MANYQVATTAGKVYSFTTDLTAAQAFDIVKGMPRTQFLDWILGGEQPTEKQTLWALKVAQESLDAQTPAAVGQFLDLVARIANMQEGRKSQVVLRFEGLTLKAVTRGYNAGGIYIFTNRGYAGKITKEGILQADQALAPALQLIAQDPEAAARAYGREHGICSCCGRGLTDPVSVFGGIGPICLARLAGEDARAELEADFREFQAENMLDAVLAA